MSTRDLELENYVFPSRTIVLSEVTVVDLYARGQVIINHGWPEGWFVSWSEHDVTRHELPTKLVEYAGGVIIGPQDEWP